MGYIYIDGSWHSWSLNRTPTLVESWPWEMFPWSYESMVSITTKNHETQRSVERIFWIYTLYNKNADTRPESRTSKACLFNSRKELLAKVGSILGRKDVEK